MAVWNRATSDPYIHSLLRTGLELPLSGDTRPARHHCAGNAIKAEHMGWARGAVHELESFGSVSRWTDVVAKGNGCGARPRMVMPLIVEPNPG